jgi:hypothetical protein
MLEVTRLKPHGFVPATALHFTLSSNIRQGGLEEFRLRGTG